MTQIGIFLSVCIILTSCNDNATSQSKSQNVFTDVTVVTGIDVKHHNGMNGNMFYPEMMGPAVAFLDYDNDGDMDIFIGQGHDFHLQDKASQTNYGKLYRNELQDGKLHFSDVTQSSGLLASGYSMGIATGDINNDGFVDIYLTNFGANQMFLNQGDGTFLDITSESNTGVNEWSSSAAFVDIDADGWLDLYVTNYLDYSISQHKICSNETGRPEYCGPNAYNSVADRLFKNIGNGQFIDFSQTSGINTAGAGLGVVTTDLNNDGKVDIYVTNDQGHNFMWINQGDGRFINEALIRGNAVNHHGRSEASMGVDTGDIDNDGDFDLFMTHLLNETNTVYLNNGNGFFTDMTTQMGLAKPSIGYTGFGTAFLDFDNDSWLDIIVINGEVRQIPEQIAAGEKLPLKQSNQLFKNNKGVFVDVSLENQVVSIANVSRGAAVGDIDNDGDIDVLISNNNDIPQLLQNQLGNKNNWIGLILTSTNGKHMTGSIVNATLKDGTQIMRHSRADASYISANDPRILIGLADYGDTVDISVQWSSGSTSQFNDLSVNQYHRLEFLQ